MKTQMQPVLVAGAALLITLQALTGFATDQKSAVPNLKARTHRASQSLGALIAQPTGSAPKALANPTKSVALSYNTIYMDGKSLRLPISAPAPDTSRCQALAKAKLQSHLNAASSLTVETGGVDSYGRTLGRIYDQNGTDIADKVDSDTSSGCS